MIYCRHCGSQIHETAVTCPSCGGRQIVSNLSTSINNARNESSSWVSITSLILGILSIIVCFDESEWDYETYIGVFSIFLLPSFVLGIVSIANGLGGKGMATTGVIMSSIACLLIIGSLAT